MKNWGPLLAMTVLLILAACEVTPTPPQAVKSRATATVGETARFASAPPDRPGPRHEMGEKRISLVGTVSFERANFDHPFAAAAIYYNEEAGIRAMAGAIAWDRGVPVLPDPAAALVTIELRDQSGRRLPGSIVIEVDPLRFANAVTFLIHIKSWWWKDFGKARKRWRRFASARCANLTPPRNITTLATSGSLASRCSTKWAPTR